MVSLTDSHPDPEIEIARLNAVLRLVESECHRLRTQNRKLRLRAGLTESRFEAVVTRSVAKLVAGPHGAAADGQPSDDAEFGDLEDL